MLLVSSVVIRSSGNWIVEFEIMPKEIADIIFLCIDLFLWLILEDAMYWNYIWIFSYKIILKSSVKEIVNLKLTRSKCGRTLEQLNPRLRWQGLWLQIWSANILFLCNLFNIINLFVSLLSLFKIYPPGYNNLNLTSILKLNRKLTPIFLHRISLIIYSRRWYYIESIDTSETKINSPNCRCVVETTELPMRETLNCLIMNTTRVVRPNPQISNAYQLTESTMLLSKQFKLKQNINFATFLCNYS